MARSTIPLRRLMTKAHLEAYDNLRQIVFLHVHDGPVFSPFVEAARTAEPAYLIRLLRPTFGDRASRGSPIAIGGANRRVPKKVEDSLRSAILSHLLPTRS